MSTYSKSKRTLYICTCVHKVTLCTYVTVSRMDPGETTLQRLPIFYFRPRNNNRGYRSKSCQRTHGDLNGTITRNEIKYASQYSIGIPPSELRDLNTLVLDLS